VKENATLGNCGIDPGIRTFLTVYSKADVVHISSDHDRFNRYFRKIDKINRNHSTKESRQIRRYEKAIKHVYDKMHNVVKDMHFKVAKYLCTRYQVLKLGKLSTKSIVSNTTSNLSDNTKRLAYALSHFRFREILQYQAKKYGVKLHVVSEYKTTKTFSGCSRENNPGVSKIYECGKCGLRADRDVNAAKNIRYQQI
jgi:putative transposase